jgi:hypothetical protein
LLSKTSLKYFIIGLLAACVSTLAVASGFSFSYSYSSKDNKQIRKFTSYGSGKPATITQVRSDNRPWGNVGDFKSGLKSEPLPKPNSNYYLGGAPGTGWPDFQSWAGQPYAQGPYGQNPYGGQFSQGGVSDQPRVEVELSSTTAYENQNILYTARVVSGGNIQTLNAIMPRIEGAILEKIDGPITSVRNRHRTGAREIVNEYHFKLTPLRSGEIGIPAISFKGTLPVNGQRKGEAFTATAPENSQSLHVKPADASVSPWLPLNDLRIQANLSQEQAVKAGRPVTLVLELTARGALGRQLPSLEQQIKSDDYRIYHDSTDYEGGVSRDGQLIGQRIETYTLIPLNDGLIKLPELSVPWWDVEAHTPRLAVLPGKATAAAAGRTYAEPPAGGEGFLNSGFFWLPLILTIGLILGFWLRDWLLRHPQKRQLLQSARSGAGKLLQPIGRRIAESSSSAWEVISPVANVNRVRMAFALVMPRRVRVWMCTRCIETLESPDEWCTAFKQKVCEHLDIPTHTALTAIGEKIIETSPHVEPAKVRSLVQTLDGAIYGGRPVDFVAWKQDFGHQLRPRLARRHWRGSRRKKAVLPGLNPRAA